MTSPVVRDLNKASLVGLTKSLHTRKQGNMPLLNSPVPVVFAFFAAHRSTARKLDRELARRMTRTSLTFPLI